jgi:hypothetical protein
MDIVLKTSIWQQFGAAIDTLEGAVRLCPDHLWMGQLWDHPDDPPDFSRYWYLVYHTLFWLDLYLTGQVEGFAPPPPYTLDELDPAGLTPAQPYSKDMLLDYLRDCRVRCQSVIETLTDESASRSCRFGWGEISYTGLLLYNMRHVQEHAAQLSLFLGQQRIPAPRWVTKAKTSAN